MSVTLLDGLPTAQRLAVSYADKGSRAATLALLALDAGLAAILRGRREPIAAQLRLAWWRERLGEPPAAWPAGEPVLEALRAWRDPSPLAVLSDGWEALLAERLTAEIAGEFIEARAQAFAGLAREVATGAEEAAAGAGRLWAAGDLAANLSDPAERQVALDLGLWLPPARPLPRALRPPAVLATLGARALRRGGGPLLDGPGAALLALRTGLTGR